MEGGGAGGGGKVLRWSVSSMVELQRHLCSVRNNSPEERL